MIGFEKIEMIVIRSVSYTIYTWDCFTRWFWRGTNIIRKKICSHLSMLLNNTRSYGVTRIGIVFCFILGEMLIKI